MESFWNKLLGRDKETAEERAFRHEREHFIFELVPSLLLGMMIGAIYLALAKATLFKWALAFALIILAVSVAFFIGNMILKRNQKKFGGD